MKLVAIEPLFSPRAFHLPLPEIALSVIAMVHEMYRKEGFISPWICYLAVEKQTVVGSCGFKAPPKENGVELAYFTFPSHEGRGVATRMVQKLLDLAKVSAPAIVVKAQTLPEESASTRILRKLNFGMVGEVHHAEDGKVWEWHHV